MWSRKELKEKGKMALNRNYWKTVLVSVLISLMFSTGIIGGIYNFGSWGTKAGMVKPNNSVTVTFDESSLDDSVDAITNLDEDASLDEIQAALDDTINSISEGLDTDGTTIAVIAVFLVVFFIIFLIALAIAMLIDAFVVYPFSVGMNRFFLVNLNDKAEVKEIGYGYDHNYKNNVKTMFLRGLYIFFWSLLLVIPGVVKSYEYRMIPYLLACVFFGMTVSCLVRYRENVMLLMVFISLPLLFMVGISWPQSAIPGVWQGVSWLFPSTFGARAYVRMNTMGATLGDVTTEVRALWIQAAFYFGVTCLVYGHQLREARRHAAEALAAVADT